MKTRMMVVVAMIGVIAMAGTAMAVMQDESGYLTPSSPPDDPGWYSYTPAHTYDEPAGANDAYMYSNQMDGFWTPGLTGWYVVEASWTAYNNSSYTDDAGYYFRSDGTEESEVVAKEGVTQRLLADQVSTGDGLWSGFHELGTFNLNSSSEFRITGWVASTEYVTSGVWQFTESSAPIPEPAGLGLMGLALLAVRRKRS